MRIQHHPDPPYLCAQWPLQNGPKDICYFVNTWVPLKGVRCILRKKIQRLISWLVGHWLAEGTQQYSAVGTYNVGTVSRPARYSMNKPLVQTMSTVAVLSPLVHVQLRLFWGVLIRCGAYIPLLGQSFFKPDWFARRKKCGVYIAESCIIGKIWTKCVGYYFNVLFR